MAPYPQMHAARSLPAGRRESCSCTPLELSAPSGGGAPCVLRFGSAPPQIARLVLAWSPLRNLTHHTLVLWYQATRILRATPKSARMNTQHRPATAKSAHSAVRLQAAHIWRWGPLHTRMVLFHTPGLPKFDKRRAEQARRTTGWSSCCLAGCYSH